MISGITTETQFCFQSSASIVDAIALIVNVGFPPRKSISKVHHLTRIIKRLTCPPCRADLTPAIGSKIPTGLLRVEITNCI